MWAYRLARPILRRLDPERAHRVAIGALKLGLTGVAKDRADPVLRTRVWGLEFPNPVGLAAGFDKDAEAVDGLLDIGFGFVEAGTVTPQPQPGNPRPRVFRLDEDRAIVNRYGFNSRGLDGFVARLRARPRRGIVGANVGKNRDTEEAVRDYAAGIEAACPYADYLVCNVSSPNTPGLRRLQARAPIAQLLQAALEARRRAAPDASRPPPLLAKVGPDLDEPQIADIAEAALECGIDGLIVGNTTLERPPALRSRFRHEAGGLSGLPLRAYAERCLRAMYRASHGRLPIVGCGGISSGADAYARIRAGASLVQVYSAFAFHGPPLVTEIQSELAACLRADGFSSVADAVGADYAGGARPSAGAATRESAGAAP